MNRAALLLAIIAASVVGACGKEPVEAPAASWHDEVIYHVMPRSFRDSNGVV